MFLAEDKLCHCLLHVGDNTESVEYCSAALKRHNEPRILCDRAENYIAMDMLDDAQQDYAKVTYLFNKLRMIKMLICKFECRPLNLTMASKEQRKEFKKFKSFKNKRKSATTTRF